MGSFRWRSLCCSCTCSLRHSWWLTWSWCMTMQLMSRVECTHLIQHWRKGQVCSDESVGWGYFLVSYTHLRWKLTLRIMTRPYKTVILELDYGFIQPTPMCHGFNANLSARYRMVIEFKSSHSDIKKNLSPNHQWWCQITSRHLTCKISQRTMKLPDPNYHHPNHLQDITQNSARYLKAALQEFNMWVTVVSNWDTQDHG